jgi:hypothetical protein
MVSFTLPSCRGSSVAERPFPYWALRATALFATVDSSLPAWAAFDPVPVVDSWEEREARDNDEDDEA